MLVLTLAVEDRIHIGDDIVVLVNDVKDPKVRLGVEAPKDCKVVRYERLKTEKRDL